MLKKILVIVVCLALVVCLYITNKNPLFLGYANTFEVYLTNYSHSQMQMQVSSNEYLFVNGIKGESCVVEQADFCLQDFLYKMNGKIIFEQILGECHNYYCYSPSIKYCQVINGKRINLHVSIRQEAVKVGSPLIYGSF